MCTYVCLTKDCTGKSFGYELGKDEANTCIAVAKEQESQPGKYMETGPSKIGMKQTKDTSHALKLLWKQRRGSSTWEASAGINTDRPNSQIHQRFSWCNSYHASTHS